VEGFNSVIKGLIALIPSNLLLVLLDIKMDLQEVGCGVVDWIRLAQDRDRWWATVNVVLNLQVQ
jgi:hypothetical protein